FRRALELRPNFSEAADNVVYSVHFHPDYDAQALLAEQRRWEAQFAAPLAVEIRPHRNDRTPGRCLRVGFVSPDFVGHPVGQSLLPLFARLDRRRAKVVCYSDVRKPDEVTGRLEALADEWHPVLGLSDAQLAERIRGEAIDILVDPTLH